MPFNVQSLLSTINKSGIAKTNNYEVQIIGRGNADTERDMMFRADSAELPGRTISTLEHKFTNYGPLNKIAYGQIYDDITISILLSHDMREKEYFEDWHNKMVNTGVFDSNRSSFNTKYFDDYVGTILIRQFGENGITQSIHTLQEAMPTIISPVSMSWGDEEAARLSVTFSYRYYKAAFEAQAQPGLRGYSLDPNRIQALNDSQLFTERLRRVRNNAAQSFQDTALSSLFANFRVFGGGNQTNE